MDFAQQQRSPARHWVSITFVIILHVIIIYALINGLARKVVDVVKKPLEVKIIEEQKPPPPPQVQVLAPPRLAAPLPPFIPPPEIQIRVPPPVNTVTAVTSTPPPPTPVFTHAAPAVASAPAPAPSKSVTVVCPNTKQVDSEIEFPGRAARERIASGNVTVEFTVGANGEASNFTITGSTNRVFNDTALEAAKKLKCIGQGQDVRVELPVHFTIQD